MKQISTQLTRMNLQGARNVANRMTNDCLLAPAQSNFPANHETCSAKPTGIELRTLWRKVPVDCDGKSCRILIIPSIDMDDIGICDGIHRIPKSRRI